MKVFAYLRVSTDQQADSGAGLAVQKAECEKWCTSKGFSIVDFFIDEGFSGSSLLKDRPALKSAIDALDSGNILLVHKRDRLSRDPDETRVIEKSIYKKKAILISVGESGTNDQSASSILMRRIVDAFAEYERNVIVDRTQRAMDAKKAKGERVGHIPYGKKLAENGINLVDDDQEISILQQIKRYMKRGYSVREIETKLNKKGIKNRGKSWKTMSVHRAMKKASTLKN